MRWSSIAVIIVLVAGAILILFRKTFKKSPVLLGAFLGVLFGLLTNLLFVWPILNLMNPTWARFFGQAVWFYFIGDMLVFGILGALIGWIVSKLRRSK